MLTLGFRQNGSSDGRQNTRDLSGGPRRNTHGFGMQVYGRSGPQSGGFGNGMMQRQRDHPFQFPGMNGNMPAFTPQMVFDMWNCKSFPMEREFQQIAMRQYASGSNDSTNSNSRYRDTSNNRSRNNFNEYESEDEQQAYNHYDGDYGFAERKNVQNAAVYSADTGSYSTNASMPNLQTGSGPFGQFSTTMSNGYSNFQTDQTLAETINSTTPSTPAQAPQTQAVAQPNPLQTQQAAALNPGFNSSLMAYYLNSANVDGNISVQNSKPSSQTKPSSHISPPQSNEGEQSKQPADKPQQPAAPKEKKEDAEQNQSQDSVSNQQPKYQSMPQETEKDVYPDYPQGSMNAFQSKTQNYPNQPTSASKPPQFVQSQRYQQEDPYQSNQRWTRDSQNQEDQQRGVPQDSKQARYPSQDPSRPPYVRKYPQTNQETYNEYPQQRYQPKPQYEQFPQNQSNFHLRSQANPQYAQRNDSGYGHHSGGYQGYQPASNYNPYMRPADDSYKYRR